jgi:hypothetical protein
VQRRLHPRIHQDAAEARRATLAAEGGRHDRSRRIPDEVAAAGAARPDFGKPRTNRLVDSAGIRPNDERLWFRATRNEPVPQLIRRTAMPALTRPWVALAAIAAAACGSYSPTTGTVTPPVDLTNTWSGSNSNSGGSGSVTEQLTQSGSTVTGTISGTSLDAGVTVTYTGTLTGTISGSTLSYSVTIPVGGYSAPYAACSLADAGSATVTDTSIHGTYAGTLTCGTTQTPVTNGAVSLTAP